jgi:hypothetical protein
MRDIKGGRVNYGATMLLAMDASFTKRWVTVAKEFEARTKNTIPNKFL